MPRLLRSPVAAAIALWCVLAVPLHARRPPRTEERRTLRVNGEDRAYLLYVPASWRGGQPAPLVLVFHGGGGRGSGIAPHTGFSRLAEREGFVVVYPDGLNRRWNDGRRRRCPGCGIA